jgi:hypothetical protein
VITTDKETHMGHVIGNIFLVLTYLWIGIILLTLCMGPVLLLMRLFLWAWPKLLEWQYRRKRERWLAQVEACLQGLESEQRQHWMVVFRWMATRGWELENKPKGDRP